MNNLKKIRFGLLTLLAVALWLAGCATPDFNPPQARANTGYVDFHADSPDELNWEVVRFDDRTQGYRNLYAELKLPAGGILRLALAPGHHRLRATFLNRVVTQPAVVEVEVQDGRITPVRITLADAGTGLVETREQSFGGRARGRFGRRTKIGSDETVLYRLSAVTWGPPEAYQLKERMPYAREAANRDQ